MQPPSLARNPPLLIGSVLVALLVFVAAAAPLLAPHDPNTPRLLHNARPPYPPGTPGFLLGSDMERRDLFSRLLYGARYTLLFGGIAACVRMLLGMILGMLAGWYRGAGRIIDVFIVTWSAVPSLFFAVGLILIFFRGADLATSTLVYFVAVSCTGWAEIAVRCRGAVQDLVHAPFVEAAYVIGRRRAAVLWRHVFANLRGVLLVEWAYAMGAVLLLVAELGFIGLYLGTPEIGVAPQGLQAEPMYAEWGSMLAVGLRLRRLGPWLVLVPAGALTITILAFNLVAEGLRRRR